MDGGGSPCEFAALDLGSNCFRLERGHCGPEGYVCQTYERHPVRLGAGLDAQGRLDEAALQRGWESLATLAPLLRGLPPKRIRAVATQTLREAVNRQSFLSRASDILGVPVEVISGDEEARLIYAGVTLLQPDERPRLVIDIGGRSTEIIRGQGLTRQFSTSVPMGSVGLTQAHFADGVMNPAAFDTAIAAASRTLAPVADAVRPLGWQQVMGASGTVNAVSQYLRSAGQGDGVIREADVVRLQSLCLRAGHLSALELAALRPDRRAALPGGVAALRAVFQTLQIEAIHPAKGALRQGVIADLQAHAAEGVPPMPPN